MAKVITVKTANPPKTTIPPVERIELRLDGGFIVAKCGPALSVYELVWTSRHGENKRVLTLRECPEVPRQFEREAYPRGGKQSADS